MHNWGKINFISLFRNVSVSHSCSAHDSLGMPKLWKSNLNSMHNTISTGTVADVNQICCSSIAYLYFFFCTPIFVAVDCIYLLVKFIAPNRFRITVSLRVCVLFSRFSLPLPWICWFGIPSSRRKCVVSYDKHLHAKHYFKTHSLKYFHIRIYQPFWLVNCHIVLLSMDGQFWLYLTEH